MKTQNGVVPNKGRPSFLFWRNVMKTFTSKLKIRTAQRVENYIGSRLPHSCKKGRHFRHQLRTAQSQGLGKGFCCQDQPAQELLLLK